MALVEVWVAFPLVEAIGILLPRTAQWLFAVAHAPDVVGPSDPLRVKELFIREAAYAHHYSVTQRVCLVSKLDMVHRLRDIHAKTLLLSGSEDTLVASASKALQDRLPNSKSSVIPVGHLV